MGGVRPSVRKTHARASASHDTVGLGVGSYSTNTMILTVITVIYFSQIRQVSNAMLFRRTHARARWLRFFKVV